MPTTILTGATGFLGSRMYTALRSRGHDVVVLARNIDKARARFPDAARVLLWAPGLNGEWRRAVGESDAVVHLAGESIGGQRWNAAYKARILESRSRGTQELAEAAASSTPPAVFVSSSGIGYYGDTGDREVDESAAPGTDFISQVCIAWERALAPASDAGVRTVAVRLAPVLSADGGALQRLLTPFRLGVGGPIGSGRQWFPWIHVDDAVALFMHALENGSVRGAVNGVAPGRVRNREFSRELGTVLHRPAFMPLPGFALRLVVGEFANALLTGQNALPGAALATGFRFSHPELREALESVLK